MLTTSKTKQSCETSFKNGQLSAELTASYQSVLRFFDPTCLNYCACHEKVIPGHAKCCTCHAKSANLKISGSKMQPLSGNQRPDLLTALMNKSLLLRLPRKMHLCRSSSNVPRLPSFLEMLQNPYILLTFDKVHNPVRLPCETTSERPKVVRACGVFLHFDFDMCFAPQWHALFRHLNFQNWSGPGVFWLRNVLRATTACNFSSLICPAGSAPAALASLLFDPPEPQIIGEIQCFATFLPFRAPGSSYFWDFIFFDLLSSSLLFADSSHLCFSSVHIVGSLTSKLPSTILKSSMSNKQTSSQKNAGMWFPCLERMGP